MANRTHRCKLEAQLRRANAKRTSPADRKREAELLRRAGLPSAAPSGFRKEHAPWTVLDVLWFQNHRSRTHRIRPILPGEDADFPGTTAPPGLPPTYRKFVIVRQIEPGRHVRTPLFLHHVPPEDDIDEFLAALMDATVANTLSGQPGGSLDPIRAAALARGVAGRA